MSRIIFDIHAEFNDEIQQTVEQFLTSIPTLERSQNIPAIIFQDGANFAYYVKCSILAQYAQSLCDLNAKLDVDNPEGYRANRELFLTNSTYAKMESDAINGREFNDIIVEYNFSYSPERPLKVWGGQHRISAISKIWEKSDRYHGFRIYFHLTTHQRADVALISNTNISVSNDTFDRMIEETVFGGSLRKWCQLVGFLGDGQDFPDVGSRSEEITVKRARSFVVNYYLGKTRGNELPTEELDNHVYDPYLVTTGTSIDEKYASFMQSENILTDRELIRAGKEFLRLHNAQIRAVADTNNSIPNRRQFRAKALVESVLCGWGYVAGLLQTHPKRLENHYRLPKTTSRVPDPLNATEMSQFKHDSDGPTYRGLGTRAALKDRQRVAQLFLAKSRENEQIIDRKFMNSAVAQVVGLQTLAKGYA